MNTSELNQGPQPGPVDLQGCAEARACQSQPQGGRLSSPPPRSPGWEDPQIPDHGGSELLYCRLSHIYFYLEPELEDAAFGLRDMEISVSAPVNSSSAVHIYCYGDGFQSGRGCSRGVPLIIEFRAANQVVARVAWPYPDVLAGNATPMTFTTDVQLDLSVFNTLDSVFVPQARAAALICS